MHHAEYLRLRPLTQVFTRTRAVRAHTRSISTHTCTPILHCAVQVNAFSENAEGAMEMGVEGLSDIPDGDDDFCDTEGADDDEEESPDLGAAMAGAAAVGAAAGAGAAMATASSPSSSPTASPEPDETDDDANNVANPALSRNEAVEERQLASPPASTSQLAKVDTSAGQEATL